MPARFAVYGGPVLFSFCMAMMLVGCGPSANMESGSKSEVSLSAKDNGRQVVVDVGKTLVLTLDSNPTTGFRWQVVEAKNAVLRQTGEAEFKLDSESDPPPPGTGGVEIFRFEAVEPGETLLELVYHQPWAEGQPPIGTFSIQVIVR